MKHIISTITIIIILLAAIYPLSKIITKKRVIVVNNQLGTNQPLDSAPIQASLVFPEKNTRTNAFFLGVPGKGNSAPNLTDTIIIMSVDKKTKEGFLLSVPRDLLVKIPSTNLYTKINSLYQRNGINSIQTVLGNITGLSFDYSIVVDLEGVKKIIDEIKGVDVWVEKDIYDPAFPGPNSSYQLFSLKTGKQHLDGETALKYIRTRHETTGDFARMRRQQQVLTAVKEKISSLHPVWNSANFINIWQALIGHFQTNLSLENIKPFWEIIKDINLEEVKFEVLDSASNLVAADHATLGNQQAYILRPRAGLDNYTEIKNFVKNLINE